VLKTIETNRLRLVPATLAHVNAEMSDLDDFSRLISAEIPANWPPESAADALPLFASWLTAAPETAGWYGWYAVARDLGDQGPILVGSGGFLGPPVGGAVTAGYSVLPQYYNRGIATEMMGGVLRWAFEESGTLQRIIAETEWLNPASARVLIKLGFVESGKSEGADGKRFELSRDRWSTPP
jgi:[ribosomal protein S5]-alanine N-acetyltransferase